MKAQGLVTRLPSASVGEPYRVETPMAPVMADTRCRLVRRDVRLNGDGGYDSHECTCPFNINVTVPTPFHAVLTGVRIGAIQRDSIPLGNVPLLRNASG